jgi:hypothetical protein
MQVSRVPLTRKRRGEEVVPSGTTLISALTTPGTLLRERFVSIISAHLRYIGSIVI